MDYYDSLYLEDDSIYAYLIVNYETKQIEDGNKLAFAYYSEDNRFPELDSLFELEQEKSITVDIWENLKEDGSLFFENLTSKKITGEEFSCDLEVCCADKENFTLFFVIKENAMEKDVYMRELIELELTANPIFVIDCIGDLKDFKVTYGNLRFFHCIRGIKEHFTEDCDDSFLSLLSNESAVLFKKNVETYFDQNKECDFDIEFSFDGAYFQLYRFNAHRVLGKNGSLKLYGVLISIKKQSELMKKIEYDQQYFDIMQEFSKDLLFRIDVNKQTLVHRGDISKFVGLLPEVQNYPESIRDSDWIHPEDLDSYIAFAYKLIHGMPAQCQPRLHFSNGTYEKYFLQGKPLFDDKGNTVQVVGKSENIQKYVDIEAKANYDSLTSALNKVSFREVVEDLLTRALEKDRYALLFLDFDNFKKVNDNMGHVFGDFLLETTGKRILNCVRNMDKVGRVGGDEFVIFFHHAPTKEAVQERAEAILNSLRREFSNGELRYSIKASIGIALFPEHGTDYDSLYDRADKALYESKSRGKDVATIFYQELDG